MEQIDNSPEKRYIPERIKRLLRREAGFGCVACGLPIIEYHHIIPWSEKNKHEAENLVVLCPGCHQKAHNKLISSNFLKSLKKLPFNKNVLIVKDKLFLHDIKKLTIHVGGAVFNNISSIIRISGKDIIYFKEENKQTTLNAIFYNKNGMLEAEIKENEWFAYINDNTWDIKYSGGTLSVKNIDKSISLNLEFNMEKNYISVTGEVYYKNKQIIMKDDSLIIKDTINNSQMLLQNVGFTNANCAINL